MRHAGYFISLLLAVVLGACATEPPRFRGQAQMTLERVKAAGGKSLLPAEYRSVVAAYQKGESFLKEKDRDDADGYYYLALLKGELLEKELREVKARQEAEAKRAEEKKKAAREQKAREEAERLAQAQAEALAQKEAIEAAARRKAKLQREHVLVASYTVKRGETLPLISSQPEVYGDRTLWPLIYRANRAQIRDPRHIWPGQVLRIPRNLGREDIAEARRYGQDKPLH